jgi:AraC family L-rhamnose operon transcriptional activator RhaR
MGPTETWRRSQVFRPGRAPVYATHARHDVDVASHDHEFVEIALVLAGRATHQTRTGHAALHAGHVLVLRPGVWHGYREVDRLHLFNCCFGAELLDRELAWTLDDPGIGPLLWGPRQQGGSIHLRLPPKLVRRAAGELGQIVHALGWAAPVGRLLQFLGTLSQGIHAEVRPSPISPMIAQVVRALDADLTRAWRIEDLATIAGISPAYLTRRFTGAMGLSPIAYLARCRAERAAARLIQTDDTIADIAVAVGWDDPVYFARRFHQHYGLAPREYRKRFSA